MSHSQNLNLDKEDLLAKLDIRRFYLELEKPSIKDTGRKEAKGFCPFHDDNNPSLSVNFETGLWHCFAGCGGGDVLDFYMRLRDIDFPTAIKEIAAMQGIKQVVKTPKVVATFEYKDPDGALLYIKERLEPGGGGRGKTFKFKHKRGGQWKQRRGHEPVLYNLPDALQAPEVFVVEGEGKVDLLNEWGLTATCLDSGANSQWRGSYTEALNGTDEVVILPDNDEPGRSYAERIADELQGKVARIKVVELPGLGKGEDIIDWARTQDNGRERLMELVEGSPSWEPEDMPEQNTEDLSSYIVTPKEILNDDDANISWLIEDFLPEGALTLLSAPPSHYKTFLAMDIARCLSTGTDFIGRPTKATPVNYIDKENPKSVVKDRFLELGITDEDRIQYFPLWTPAQLPSIPNEFYQKLVVGRPFIILDSLVRFYPRGADENLATHMAPIMGFLKKLAVSSAGVLVLHHSGRSEGSAYRGSSDILGSADIAYAISRGKKDHSRISLKPTKSRYEMEKDILIGIESDITSVKFVDIEQKARKEQQQKDIEEMKIVQQILNKSGPLNQSQLLVNLQEGHALPKRRILKLLEMGNGKYWVAESKGIGKPTLYRLLEPEDTANLTSPPLHQYIHDGEVERSDDDIDHLTL